MILIDTSIWIDSFRTADPDFALLLAEGLVLQHPFVTGELAMGNLHGWRRTVDLLSFLPAAPQADSAQMLDFVEEHELAGTGIGFVDVHLLASAYLARCHIWTRDRRLRTHTLQLGLMWEPSQA